MSQIGRNSLGPNAQVSDALLKLRRANERIAANIRQLEERGSNEVARRRVMDDRAEARNQCRDLVQMFQSPQQGLDVSRFLDEFKTELNKFESSSQKFKQIEKDFTENIQTRSTSTSVSRPSAAAAAAGASAAAPAQTGGKSGKKSKKGGKSSNQQNTVIDMGGRADFGGLDIGAMMGGGSESSDRDPMLDGLQTMDSEMEEGLISYEASELRQREELVHELEADVVLIHEWVLQFNELVHQQGEQLEQIEDVLIKTKEKTKEAHVVLEEAEDYQKKARKKKCCIVVILVIVAAVIAIGVWQSVV